MKKYLFLLFAITAIAFQSCIGDDIEPDEVTEQVRILNPIDSLGIDSTYQIEVSFFNNVGLMDSSTSFIWSSSAPSIIDISSKGLLTGKSAGNSIISVTANSLAYTDSTLSAQFEVGVAENVVTPPPVVTQREVTINTTSSYDLSGSGVLKSTPNGLVLELNNNYNADTGLPDLVVYLSNNPNTNNGALQIAEVTVFNGAHSYIIPSNPDINQYSHVLYYCRKFSVKVGDGKLSN